VCISISENIISRRLKQLSSPWISRASTYGPVSHCFNSNGSGRYVEDEGISGIMSTYANALHNFSLDGPTLFGLVINFEVQIVGIHYIIFHLLDQLYLD